MKRVFLFALILFALSAPVLAQSTTVDPATYLPADTLSYVELRSDSAGVSGLQQIFSFADQLRGTGQAGSTDSLFALGISDLLPGIDINADILSWVGDRVGFAEVSLIAPTPSRIIVLPIRDASAAQAFITKATAGSSPASVAGISEYTTSTAGLLVAANVIWLGDPAAIDLFVKTPMFAHLSDDARFQQVRAALPADAVVTAYFSAAQVQATLGQSASASNFVTYLQAALRLHPAQSPIEDALLQSPALNGVGFAVQVSDARFDVTGALSVNAQYSAPTLSNASAGTALLNVVPANSFLVFDSYDVSLLALAAESIFGINKSVAESLDVIETRNSLGTVEPTPSPAPASASPSADALVAQIQPMIQQAAAITGMSLDQLYSLINGEYALALFPGAGPTIGAALYLQSSNPQQIIDTLDHVSKLILTDPASGQQLFTVTHSTVSGSDVALVSETGMSDRLALGVLNGDVLFVTQESTVAQVLTAPTQNATSPAINWRDSFGTGQEALFYADPRTIDLYHLDAQRTPPLPMTALAGSVDAQDNGLFVAHLAITTGS